MWIVLLSAIGVASDVPVEPATPEPVAEPAEEPEIRKPEVAVQVGGSLTSGNSAAHSAILGLRVAHFQRKGQVDANAAALFGRSVADSDANGIISPEEREAGYLTNQQQVVVDVGYARTLVGDTAATIAAGVLIDTFSGYNSRTFQQVGVRQGLLKTDRALLTGGIGVEWAQENYVAGADPGYQNVYAAMFVTDLSIEITEGARFVTGAKLFPNLLVGQDLRVLTNAAVDVRFSDALTFRTAHGLRFDSQPVPGFRPADHAITVSLILAPI